MAIITCTYCGKEATHSDEHILQKGLGGNLTFKDVCRTCNTEFSAIDQALTDHSVVALSRLVETPAAKEVTRAPTELVHDPDLDLWKEVTVSNQLSVAFIPQLHYRGGGKVVLAGTSGEPVRQFMDELEKRVAKGDIETHRIKVDPDCGTARIGLRRMSRGKPQFVVRAPTLEAGKELLKLLNDHWPKVKLALDAEPRAGMVNKPKFQGQLRLDLNGSFRAIAKTVFNYLSYRKGVAYARRPEYDDIREYIRGNNVVLPDVTEDSLAVDGRWVRFVPYGKLNFLGTKTHTIFLTRLDGAACGILTLYAKHTFIVVLATNVDDFEPMAHEFSTDGSWNHELALEELFERYKRAAEFHDETSDGGDDDGAE